MIMFNKRVTNKGVYNNMYATTNNRIIVEHKRNKALLDNVVLNKVDFPRIKHHMKKLNKQVKHIHYKLFINLYVIKQYKLNKIQLHVLYQHMLFNSHIK
jgi:hypothetical protein